MFSCASLVLLLAPGLHAESRTPPPLALSGVTVVDPDSGAGDVEDAVVLIVDGRIESVAPRGEVPLPPEARVVDLPGRYVVPGLVDAFAALNDQRYADAYLASGVTSLIGVSGGRRGDLFRQGSPSPRVHRLESVGFEEAPFEQHARELERLALEGVDVLLLMYSLEADQVARLARRAHELGMATIGELGRAPYARAGELGLDAVVHTTRYSLDIAPAPLREAVAAEPFSDDLESPKWRYYLHLASLPEGDSRVARHSKALASSGVALIPTISLLYLDLPWARNPWQERVADILEPSSIHRPADPETGRHTEDAETLAAYAAVARAVERLEASNVAAGCRYVAGSGTDVWGTMPGISLHTELEGLVRAGLTPRQALRAATLSPAEVFRWPSQGRVAPGQLADLAVLDADPRADVAALREPELVVLGGALLEPSALLARKRDRDGDIVGEEQLPLSASRIDTTPGAGAFREGSEHLAGLELSALTYLSDGLRVKAMLVAPRGEGPFPGLIYCRGGNREFGEVTPERAQRFLATLASWGYVVVAPQYRGNAGGEGREEYGGADVDDVLNLLPLLERHPKVDPERLGLYGGSRGAMMGLLAMRRTDRLRAAVFRCGLTDLVTWPLDRPGIETVYEELIPDYDPEDDAPLVARSPLYWADELPKSTPILWMHGTADWRVTPASGLRFAAALQAARHPYRLLMLEGADHSLSGFEAERDAATRAWLDRFVRDLEPAPSMEPHGD